MSRRIKIAYRLWQVGLKPALAWAQAGRWLSQPKWNGRWGRKP